MATETLLEIKNLSTYFDTKDGVLKAVNDVSFNIDRGEILGIIGESSAGKTVIASSIMRLIPYPGKIINGEIMFKNENILKKSSSEMSKIRGNEIAMIFQDPMSCLNPVFTIGDQITSGIQAHKKITKKEGYLAAVKALEEVQISAPENRVNGYQHELSGGMKQRVMIALALINQPELIIADNPTTALDSTIQLQFLNLILNLRKEHNTTILYITHDFGVIAKLCDRVAVLYAGEIVEIGTVFDVLTKPKHPYTIGLINSSLSPGMERKGIKAIRGKTPDMTKLKTGCKFAERCDQKFDDCVKQNINMLETGHSDKSHKARCLLHRS